MPDFNLSQIVKAFPEIKFEGLNTEFIQQILPERNPNSSKHDFGHALLMAGSEDKAGAAILATKACLRSGAGLTTVHLPGNCRIAMNISCPEAMLSLDKNESFISQTPALNYKTALGIGPGIGTNPETEAVVLKLLQSKLPKVIDADALNCLARHPDWFQYLDEQTILTPHHREFDRLTKEHNNWKERFLSAKKFVSKHKCVLILKAPQSLIFDTTGKVYYNTTGNSGLAKGGSGDVLTGIITAYLAQGMNAIDAALTGVYNHGLAADLAVKEINPQALLAGDIIDFLRKIKP